MIASVHGRVAALRPDAAVLEIGGVGLLVACAPSTLAGMRVGEQARLATSLVVREDSLTLYGFTDADERGVFEILQTASGVGPRLAQAMLAVHAPEVLRRAIATEDLATLTQVPGVGKKGAARLVLELRDRLAPSSGGALPARPASASSPPWREQLHGALLGLGWSGKEAEAAVERVAPQAEQAAADADGGTPDVAELLRSALRVLSAS